MNIKEAQYDMCKAYTGGSTGAFASGLIWISSGIVALFASQISTIVTFFVGGMFIYPLGILFDKFINRSGKHDPKNPLAKWAILSTFLIFIGLYIAYMLFQSDSSLFFPIMMIFIGIRYIIFQYLYGMNVYLIFGATLVMVGIVFILLKQQFFLGAIVGGVIEIIFSIFIFQKAKQFN